jgi:predicted transglutaminase-like protease
MLAVAFGIQHVNANEVYTSSPCITPNSSAGSGIILSSDSSIPPANYDEQLGMYFTQNFLNMAYNVTAVAQNETYGYGPAYLLNGLSNSDYWYQVGLSYNWPYEPGGVHEGFHFFYEVFNSNGTSIFPPGGGGGISSFSGSVNPGDSVLLNLYFSNGNVVMSSYDWNTRANASEIYSAEGGTFFTDRQLITAHEGVLFTGLMTEEYHPSVYYGGEQFVTYSNSLISLSSASLWIDEFYAPNRNVFNCTSSRFVVFNNYHQLDKFSAIGATEYADAYVFSTGKDPVSINLTAPPVRTDAGLETRTQFSAVSSGGVAPYTYFIFLDNTLIGTYSSNSSTYNANVDFGLQNIGSHVYYVNLIDSNGYRASSNSANFTVNPEPQASISSVASVSLNSPASLFTNFFISNSVVQANANVWGGTPPYTYTWYLNGFQVGQTNVSSYEYRFAAKGTYQLQVNVTDVTEFTVESQIMTIRYGYDVVHIVLVAAVIAIIAVALREKRKDRSRGGYCPTSDEIENSKIKSLASRLKAESYEETLTNILEWQDRNIEFWTERHPVMTIFSYNWIIFLAIDALFAIGAFISILLMVVLNSQIVVLAWFVRIALWFALNIWWILAIFASCALTALVTMIFILHSNRKFPWKKIPRCLNNVIASSISLDFLLENKLGVCRDYAKLTACLLSELYPNAEVFFARAPNHVATGINIENSLYMLDQRLPILTKNKWNDYRKPKKPERIEKFDRIKKTLRKTDMTSQQTKGQHELNTQDLAKRMTELLNIKEQQDDKTNSLQKSIPWKKGAILYEDNKMVNYSLARRLKMEISNELININQITRIEIDRRKDDLMFLIHFSLE